MNDDVPEPRVDLTFGSLHVDISQSAADVAVTRLELIEIVQAMQKFVVSSSVLTLTATTSPENLKSATDELNQSVLKVQMLLMKLVGAA